MRVLNFQILTWNVGSSEPISDKDIQELLQLNTSNPIDVYAVYFQEIETGLVETAKSFVSFDSWTKAFTKLLANWNYYLVENVRVQGITMSVFSRLVHLPYIRYIKTDIERTGALASTWGNKGGVAISCSIYSLPICFLNTHLAAHLGEDKERIDDFQEVLDEIDFGGTTTVFEHEIVFWAGDLNFRIETLERDDIIKIALARGPYDKLLQHDQLKKHLKQNCSFSEFTEGPIDFPPTYKFDRGTNNYDTGEKQRKPAYTDRVLHRVNPHKTFVHDMVKMQLQGVVSSGDNSSYAEDLVKQVPASYKSLPQFRQSDHKPVTAKYTVSISDYPAPLVDLSVDSKITDDVCEVDVTYNHGMVADSKDYLALYEEKFTDARSYETYKYIEGTDGTEVKEKFHKICKFSPDDVKKDVKFRIGYYSHRMSCLLALSKPFEIQC